MEVSLLSSAGAVQLAGEPMRGAAAPLSAAAEAVEMVSPSPMSELGLQQHTALQCLQERRRARNAARQCRGPAAARVVGARWLARGPQKKGWRCWGRGSEGGWDQPAERRPLTFARRQYRRRHCWHQYSHFLYYLLRRRLHLHRRWSRYYFLQLPPRGAPSEGPREIARA